MEILTVAIIEDNDEEAAHLEEYFVRYEKQNGQAFRLIRFRHAEAFLNHYKPAYDLVMMDIILSGRMNGMEAAEALRKVDPEVTLVFVTNMARFAVKGYEVNAFDFLVKPITYAHFCIKIERVLKRLSTRRRQDILLSTASQSVRIQASGIQYIEISSHRLIYHTVNGVFDTYGSLKKAEEALDSAVFTRCNSCYLVNLNYVTAVDTDCVTVAGDRLQISRARRKGFLQRLNDFLGGDL